MWPDSAKFRHYVKTKKPSAHFYVLFSIWQIFDTSLVIFKPLGKFSLLQNGHIFNTLYTHLVSLSFDKKKRETLEHTNGYSRSTHKQDVPRLSLILGHLGLLHIFGRWSGGLAATYWLWSCGFESRHHSEKKLNNRDHFCKTHLMSQMLTLYLATWPSKETIIF